MPHACLSQMTLPLGRTCGKCPDAARPHHQRAEETRQQGVDRLWSVPMVWFFWTLNWNTERHAAPLKPPEDTTHVFTPPWVD